MSKFQVLVSKITAITPHPNANKLELGRIKDFQVVLGKGAHQPGDLVAVLPEQALVPEWLLRHLGFWNEAAGKGKLAGPMGDRVHPVELRGELSMALPVKGEQVAGQLALVNGAGVRQIFAEGDDLVEFFGCTKYCLLYTSPSPRD